MIRLGEVQNLKIKRFTSVGAYLNVHESNENDVLLPKAQIPDGAKVGDTVEVMVYNDSRDRIIATMKKAKVQVGEMAHLMVVSQTKIGSFLDWGLEKDLFLPFFNDAATTEMYTLSLHDALPIYRIYYWYMASNNIGWI